MALIGDMQNSGVVRKITSEIEILRNIKVHIEMVI